MAQVESLTTDGIIALVAAEVAAASTVTSVNGEIGVVVLTAFDVGADNSGAAAAAPQRRSNPGISRGLDGCAF